MRLWIFALLPLLFIGCRDKITGSNDGGGGGGGNGFESPGLMPLKAGNWWEYRYTSGSDTGTFRRSIRSYGPVRSSDYYLVTDSLLGSGRIDTLAYWRNIHDVGLLVLDYPVTDTTREDTLFAYPHFQAGSHYRYEGDSVLVLNSPPGSMMLLGDSLIKVMAYQRFRHAGGGSYRYYLKSDSSGLYNELLEGAGSGGYSFVRTAYHLAP